MIFWLAAANAHPLAPGVLRLTESPDGVEAVWRVPAARPTGSDPTPVLPCPVASGPERAVAGSAVETRWILACAELSGEVGVDGLVTDALVELRRASGVETYLLHPGRPRLTIPDAPGPLATLREHLDLGARHLLAGYDHLLFLLVLVLVNRRLVHAVTAFTVGHGTSLALVGLGAVSLPQWPIEVGIAASLTWLARDALAERSRSWAVCAPFGLLHGLGFAGAFREAGASGSIVQALVGFNLGIELAQLGVVGVFAVLLRSPSTRARAAIAWAVGSVGAMWVLERLLQLA